MFTPFGISNAQEVVLVPGLSCHGFITVDIDLSNTPAVP
jgi:hypothetical protein